MTLFAIPFTCSLAARLALTAVGAPHRVRWMHRFEHRLLDDGADYAAINPKRRVPALLLDDGELLTEIPAVLTHVDAAVERSAAARRRHLEWVCFVASEVHAPVLYPLFLPSAPAEVREDALRSRLPRALDLLAAALADRPTLVDGPPGGADFYLLWALILLRFRHPDQTRPELDAFRERLVAAPWVAELLADERARLPPR